MSIDQYIADESIPLVIRRYLDLNKTVGIDASVIMYIEMKKYDELEFKIYEYLNHGLDSLITRAINLNDEIGKDLNDPPKTESEEIETEIPF